MTDYITVPLETDPEDLIADAVAALQAKFPGWTPSDGNLDYWIIQAMASQMAEVRDVASAVTDTIFRYFGNTVMGIPPIDAESATTTTTWTVTDNQGYTIPAGTQVGIRTAGDDLIPFTVLADVVIPSGTNTTAVGGVVIVALTPGADGTNLGSFGGPVELIDPLYFVNTITMVSPTAGGVDAEADDAYLSRLSDFMTLLAPRPILPSDYATLSRTIAGVARATAIDGYNPLHNWLSANAASAETDATGWVNDSNATLSTSGTQAADGLKSLTLTPTAGGTTVDARSAQAIAVLPGETWTALASFRANTTVRSVRVGIRWYSDAGGTVAISTSFGAAANDVNTAFTAYLATAVAPANAQSARVILEVTTPAAAEIHYVDKMSLRRGSGTDWVAGGTAESGNARMVAVAVVDENGAAVSTGVKNAVQTLLQARREVNFVVSVIDPTYTTIDVSYTVHVAAGFDSSDVIARINTALTNYLSPANWGGDFFSSGVVSQEAWANQTVVRYLELAQVVNSITGVDYITLLQSRISGGTLASADITIGGAVPMPQPGVMTGTAV